MPALRDHFVDFNFLLGSSNAHFNIAWHGIPSFPLRRCFQFTTNVLRSASDWKGDWGNAIPGRQHSWESSRKGYFETSEPLSQVTCSIETRKLNEESPNIETLSKHWCNFQHWEWFDGRIQRNSFRSSSLIHLTQSKLKKVRRILLNEDFLCENPWIASNVVKTSKLSALLCVWMNPKNAISFHLKFLPLEVPRKLTQLRFTSRLPFSICITMNQATSPPPKTSSNKWLAS